MMMPPQPLLAFRRTANVMCRSVSMGAQVSSPWCLFVLLDFRPYVTPEGFEPSRHELDSSWHSSAYYTGTPDATRARFDRPPIQQCHFDNTIAQRNSTCTPLRHSVDNIFVKSNICKINGKRWYPAFKLQLFFPFWFEAWCNQVTSSGVSSIFYFSRNLSHFFLKYPNGLFNLHPLENQPNIYLEQVLKYPKGLFNRHPLVNQSMAT